MNNYDNTRWYGNLRNLLQHRITNLFIGDALVCEETGWRVDCGEDAKRLGERQFVISHQGEELARRKRISSTVDYLVGKGAPHTLEFVPEGAMHLIQLERLDGIDLLGYLPTVDKEVDEAKITTKKFYKAQVRFLSGESYMKKDSPNPLHAVLRLVVQDHQATWFGVGLA